MSCKIQNVWNYYYYICMYACACIKYTSHTFVSHLLQQFTKYISRHVVVIHNEHLLIVQVTNSLTKCLVQRWIKTVSSVAIVAIVVAASFTALQLLILLVPVTLT